MCYPIQHVSSTLYLESTTGLSSYNYDPLKLSNSHGGGNLRRWAKEAVGVLLVEVCSLSLTTTASTDIEGRAQSEM